MGNYDDMTGAGGRWRSRAIIIRCQEDTYDRILAWVQQVPHCQVVFTKSSDLKLMIKEVGW